MKAPSFSPAAAGAFFINHGEKVVVSIVSLVALLMIWWGVSAAQSQGVDRTRTPEAIESLARQAASHIEGTPQVPEGKVPKIAPFAPRVDPWRPGAVKLVEAAARPLVFDRPLYTELTKRTKPEVFPIEDLRAVAGVAVFADPNAQARGGVAPPMPVMPVAPSVETPPSRPSRGRGRGAEPPVDMGLGFGAMEEPVVANVPADEQVGPGRIAPFVIVTGLIPSGKQQAEFASRFSTVSFRDPRRDTPRWADYIVERTRVVAGAAPRWERLKLVNVARLNADPAAGPAAGPAVPGSTPLHPEKLPAGFFLQPGEAEVEYAAAIPERVDRPWGEESIHPWFVPEVRELLAKGPTESAEPEAVADVKFIDLVAKPLDYIGKPLRLTGVVLESESKVQKNARLHRFAVRGGEKGPSVGLGTIGDSEKPVFATSEEWGGRLAFDLTKPRTANVLVRVDRVGKTPVARLLEIEFLDDEGEVVDTRKETAPEPVTMTDDPTLAGAWGQQGTGVPVELSENRLFRFVDLTVVPGGEYRYRVRFALRNPNVGLAPQHVTDGAITKGDFLLAEYSPESPTVRVPEPVRILARTMPREAAKALKVKGDSVEVIVMAKSDSNGNYGLRSVITPPGGVANVDPSLNKPSDRRHFGELATTDRLLVDVRGMQEERAVSRSQQPPVEPLDMLFLRPNGEFEVVSAADSELLVRKYRSTLFAPGDDLPFDAKPVKTPKPAP